MEDLISRSLAEDLGEADLTGRAVVPENALARARIEQKAPGVIAGLAVAEGVFHQVDHALHWSPRAEQGEWRDGGVVAEIAGSARSILAGERVALNFLGRLSGIATLTARFVSAVEGTGARVLDTRKTTPGMRALEKQAVLAGGGHNHRFGLYDAVLVKENHARIAGGVGKATARALRDAPSGIPVEVECSSLDEVREALDAGAARLLLDNMGPDDLREAVDLANGRAELEASGGITLDNVRAVAETGVEYISVGALTHSAPALDLSLQLEPM
jgi:nicotinate-nucleotide pyrophosphorylase (carboxylating)